jgi:RimJ/RimL family protein N-acetyltransferase
MVAFLEDLARDKGLSKISLTVNIHNSNSIKMYEKVGFHICGTAVQDIGNGFVMDDYKMEKRL